MTTAAGGVAAPSKAPISVTPPPGSEQAASMAAAQTGQRVIVDRLRTGTTEVYANPDGSFTAEMYADPVRVRQGGAWVPVDSSLHTNSDGTLSPKASVTDMHFSGGGTGPLFTVVRGGVSVAVSWPHALPKPSLSGDTATYPEVYPGVDLEVTAAGSAVTHRVIVKTPEAAKDPRVRSIIYGQKVTGGKRVAKAEGAGFVITDPVGETVFESPEPLMWDSSSSEQPATAGRSVASSEAGAGSGSDPGSPSSEGPREGDQVSDLPVSLAADSITVTPAVEMLDSPSTVFPVAIDPTTAPAISNWAMVDAAYPTVSYYKYSSADQGVGYQNFSAWSRKRLFYGFTTSGLNSTQIISAKFSAYEVYSATCAAGTVDAYLSNDVTSGTTWNAQPSRVTGILSSFSTKAGRSDCLSGGTWGEWNVTEAVKNRVAAKKSLTTIQLAGRSETTISSWMRFAGPSNSTVSRRPKLSVTYNNPPAATPTSSMKAPDTATACATSASSAPRINPTSSTAYLNAKAYDAQGGTLTMAFRLFQGGTLKKIYYTPSFTASAGAWTAYLKAPMIYFSGLSDGGLYSWDVATKDSQSAYVNWSSQCYFIADTNAPAAPTMTTTVDTEQLLPASTTSVPVTFRQADATAFKYSVAEADKGYVTANAGAATVNADVSRNVVRVGARARDAASNVGAESSIWVNKAVPRRLAVYSVLSSDPSAARVGAVGDAALTADWDLPVGAETGLGDGRYGPCGDPASAACGSDLALDFAPGSPGLVVGHRPLRTDDSYTIGAWVFVAENSGSATILEQKGTSGAYRLAFAGDADGGSGRFTFRVGSGATAVTASDGMASGEGLRVGGWTYVAGTYDKATSASYPFGRIWVTSVQIPESGIPVEESVGASVNLAQAVPQSTGDFLVGDSGALPDETQVAPLQGRVDEISAWQQAYDPATSADIRTAAGEKPLGG